MAWLLLAAGLILIVAVLRLLMVTPPERMAAFLRKAVPIAMIAVGAGLTLAGRGVIGVPLAGFGFMAYRRLRRFAPPSSAGAGASSTVRSPALEMTLDHDTGVLDGRILAGRHAGGLLSALSPEALRAVYAELIGEPESLRLLEAYLDSSIPGWRADFEPQMGDGLGGTPGASTMTEQQAHQILGLQPGATLAEIREAHRRLMKRVHPDHGGSDFLAARINEAKAFLIERHR